MSWVAVAVGVGSMAAGVYSSSQQEKSAGKALRGQEKQNWLARQWSLEDYQTLMADWKKNAFPNQGAIKAEQQSAQNMLGQAYQGMGDKVFSQSASRGFGPGSGLTMQSLGNQQGSYMNALSQMYTNLAKFKNTSQWSAPSSIGQTNMPPVATMPAGGGMAQVSDMLGTYSGMMMMNNLLNPGGGGGGGGNMPGYSTPYGAQFGVANPKYGW